MLHRLRRHPFPVVAHFDYSLVLAYAYPERVLEPLLPPGLKLDTVDGLGFLAIAMVQTRRLRPAGIPRWLGQDFFLAGYRIFTRFPTVEGKILRGLRILRSDTNKRNMAWAGNLFTHYNYHVCRAEVQETPDSLSVRTTSPDGSGDIDVTATLTPSSRPPSGSPFRNLREARKFAGPLPFTFDYEQGTNSIVVIEGVRDEWNPIPVDVHVRKNTFLEQPALRDHPAVLANAFLVRDVPYRWKRGVAHPLSQVSP